MGLSSKAKAAGAISVYLAGVRTYIESQYEAYLEKIFEFALGKATSSESLVLSGNFNAHVGIDNATLKGVIAQHGELAVTKTEGVYCSSVPPMDCA